MSSNLALALGGGGARAAYQVGFLRRMAKDFPELHIPIITGVSAGAINTAFLANNRESFATGVEQLASFWEKITVAQIFHGDPFALAWNFLRWSLRLVSGGAQLLPPTHGLVNTKPLRRYLLRAMHTRDGSLPGITDNLQRGRLRAVGITTTNYSTGQTITWVQGENLAHWERPRRRSDSATLSINHVMASCALPLFFPAIRLGKDWHGDGGIGLTAPLSPALHLGASRILAISARYRKSASESARPTTRGYPPPATVIGLLLNTVFLDMLDYDAMIMERTNKLLRERPEEQRLGLRPVQLLVVRPSQDLESLAADYESTLPKSFRHLTRGLGTRAESSSDLLAMVLFAPKYIRRVMEIGEQDAEHRRDEVAAFMA